MNSAGWRFRQLRERLNLTYREIEEATSVLATAKLNPEYQVSLSRLFEIENKNIVPNIYRIYSLCAVYRVEFGEALRWYGLDLKQFQQDAELFTNGRTHPLPEPADSELVRMPVRLDPGFNPKESNYLSRMIQRWGTIPLSMLRRLDSKQLRYGQIGENDWMMYPLIMPGALIQIDPQRQRITPGGWRNEFERPIYFLETREAYVCSWVTSLESGQLLLQPYPLSPCKAAIRAAPAEIQVIGQVTGVAMKLCGAAEKDQTRANPG